MPDTPWWQSPLREGEFDVPVMFRVTAPSEAQARQDVERIVGSDQFERHTVPMYVPGPSCECDGNTVPGALYDPQAGTVERCDGCERFDGDLDAALAVAEKLGKQAWFIRHDHATGERRVTLVTAEIASGPDEGWWIESETDPWIGNPEHSWLAYDDEGAIRPILPPVASPERAGEV